MVSWGLLLRALVAAALVSRPDALAPARRVLRRPRAMAARAAATAERPFSKRATLRFWQQRTSTNYRGSLWRIFAPSLLAFVMSWRSFGGVCAVVAQRVARSGSLEALGASNAVLQQGVPCVPAEGERFEPARRLLGLVFSIFINNTYQAMYDQQEATYLALFAEVSCARALLEQTVLVLGGADEPRARAALGCVRRYVRHDLRRIDATADRALRQRFEAPAASLGVPTYADEAAQFGDPLEALLYLSSVGDPSTHVYATVRELRGLRARRLGALQRKLPPMQFAMLYSLAGALLASFVLTVAACPAAATANHALEAAVFGLLTFALTASLRVLQDLWSPRSGAYNVDAVLATMVRGLEAQLDELLGGDAAAAA